MNRSKTDLRHEIVYSRNYRILSDVSYSAARVIKFLKIINEDEDNFYHLVVFNSDDIACATFICL